jgi:predicted secreted acid phosphatase
VKRILTAIFFVLISVSSLAYAEPENIHWVSQRLLQYHDSGAYQEQIEQVAQQAKDYLYQRVEQRGSRQKLAIMIDIDETALSNFPAIREWLTGINNVGDTLTRQELETLTKPFLDRPIQPVLALYRYAHKHKVAVFFVTGRTANDRRGTIRNMHRVGFDSWKKLVMRRAHQQHMTAQKYKSEEAKKIVQDGYDLVLAIGDQDSDLPRSYADRVFKLPNPFYYVT